MRVRFFGTRGSIATQGPHTLRYGGNTSCTEVQSSAGTLVILDMGTGAAVLGRELMARGEPLRGHILISHTHWDHIQGIPFFAPLFVPGFEWDIYGPRGLHQGLRQTLAGQMQSTYFPVTLEQLGATIRYRELVEGRLRIGDIEVTCRYLNHPALTLGYRLEAGGVALVYACDHEPHSHAIATGVGDFLGEDRRHAEFLASADLVVHDAQYRATNTQKRSAGATAPSSTRAPSPDLRRWDSSRSPIMIQCATTQRSTLSSTRCVPRVFAWPGLTSLPPPRGMR